MAQTSVAQFAIQLKMPAGSLLEQLQKAGVAKKQVDDLLSEQDKSRLLDYLRVRMARSRRRPRLP
jgi:translation initiation factor IF-2